MSNFAKQNDAQIHWVDKVYDVWSNIWKYIKVYDQIHKGMLNTKVYESVWSNIYTKVYELFMIKYMKVYWTPMCMKVYDQK